MSPCVHAKNAHTNQYAKPEPLRSLITASLTAATGFYAPFSALKCPEKGGFWGARCVHNLIS